MSIVNCKMSMVESNDMHHYEQLMFLFLIVIPLLFQIQTMSYLEQLQSSILLCCLTRRSVLRLSSQHQLSILRQLSHTVVDRWPTSPSPLSARRLDRRRRR